MLLKPRTVLKRCPSRLFSSDESSNSNIGVTPNKFVHKTSESARTRKAYLVEPDADLTFGLEDPVERRSLERLNSESFAVLKEDEVDLDKLQDLIFQEKPGGMLSPMNIDSKVYDLLNSASTREKKITSAFESQTMQELMNLQSKDSGLRDRVRAFDLTLRRGLFTTTNFQKMALKEYIKHTRRTGHNEFLLESLFRQLACYFEIKGETGQRGEDVYGMEFWNSSLFADVVRDLGYLTLPGVELDHNCLLSLMDSFRRMKYKDHRILGPLSLKLVLGVKFPDDSMLYSTNNEFSPLELKKFIDESKRFYQYIYVCVCIYWLEFVWMDMQNLSYSDHALAA